MKKTFLNYCEAEINIRKSRFIAIGVRLEDEDFDLRVIIKEIQKVYPKATHYCYAYKYENSSGSNDDGEPAGTAGVPIMKIITENNLDRVLICVVRYFGGIKLGASGLVRAYMNSSKELLTSCEFESLQKFLYFNVTFKYDMESYFINLFKDITIVSKDHAENVTYKVALLDDKILKENSHLLIKYEIIEEN